MLSNIKLTLTQWLLIAASALIGLLVLAFRLQGRKLHQTQLQLLAGQIEHEMEKRDEKVKRAKERFKKALKAYRDGQ